MEDFNSRILQVERNLPWWTEATTASVLQAEKKKTRFEERGKLFEVLDTLDKL